MRSDIRLISVEPDSPFHGLEGLKHMATAMVPNIYDPSLIDETIFVDTESAESKVRALARDQGLLVGWSTGAALVAADLVLGEHPLVVIIGPDGAGRYLSEARRWLGD
jgi:cysteine synthase B